MQTDHTEVEIYLNYVGQFQVPVEQHEPTEEERIAAEKKQIDFAENENPIVSI